MFSNLLIYYSIHNNDTLFYGINFWLFGKIFINNKWQILLYY